MRSETLAIQPSTAPQFLERFTAFGDALIHAVNIQDYCRNSGSRRVDVELEAKDIYGRWSRVLCVFEGVSEAVIKPNSGVVFEAGIAFESDGRVCMNFDDEVRITAQKLMCCIEKKC